MWHVKNQLLQGIHQYLLSHVCFLPKSKSWKQNFAGEQHPCRRAILTKLQRYYYYSIYGTGQKY